MSDPTKIRDIPTHILKNERSYQLLKQPPFVFDTPDGHRRVDITRDAVSKACRLWYAEASMAPATGYLLFEGGAGLDLEGKATSIRLPAYTGSTRMRIFEVLVSNGFAALCPHPMFGDL